MKKYLYILFVLLMSCSTENSSEIKSLNHVKDVSFNSGFNSYYNSSVRLINEENFYCAANYKTNKEIVLHSLNNKTKHVIDLKKIIYDSQEIMSYDLISLDTIVVMTSYTNLVYLINGKGNVLKKIDLNPYLELFYDKTYYFETSAYVSNLIVNDTSLICRLTPYLNKNLDLDEYYKRINVDSLPMLFKVDNIFKDTLSVHFGGYNFYKNYIKENDFNMEPPLYYVANNKIIIRSNYSDTLYVMNTVDLGLEKKVNVISNFSKLCSAPPTIKEFKENINIHNEIENSTGKISSIYYDEIGNKYFVCVFHSKKNSNDEREMSIIILDEKFEKIDELEISNEYGEIRFIINSDLYFSSYKDMKCKDYYEKNFFSIFRYE